MALTQQTVLEALQEIPAPGSRHGLVEAGTVRGREIDGSTVRLTLAVQVTQPADVDAGVVRKGAIMGALTLYLDFINLFLMLLRILGNRE